MQNFNLDHNLSLNHIKFLTNLSNNNNKKYINQSEIIENTDKFNASNKYKDNMFPHQNFLGVDPEIDNNRDNSFINNLLNLANKKKYINYALKTEEQINKAYVSINNKYIPLLLAFIDYKLQNGNLYEKEIYRNMKLNNFITRLLQKVPLSYNYIGNTQSITLRNGDNLYLENIDEKQSYNYEYFYNQAASRLKNDDLYYLYNEYLTPHEIELSSFINIISEVSFNNINALENINNSENYNDIDYVLFSTTAPIIGCNGFLDQKYFVVTKEQNDYNHGFGYHYFNSNNDYLDNKILASFWNEKLYPTMNECDSDYVKLHINNNNKEEVIYLNYKLYFNKLHNMINDAYSEAVNQAKQKNKKVEINILPISFENMSYEYATNKELIQLFMLSWLNCYNNLSEENKQYIARINFSYFEDLLCHNFSLKHRKNDNIMLQVHDIVSEGQKKYKDLENIIRDKIDHYNLEQQLFIFNNDIIKCDQNNFKFIINSKHPFAFVGNNAWDDFHANESIFEKIANASNICQVQNSYINQNISGDNCYVYGNNNIYSLSSYVNKYKTQIMNDVNKCYERFINYNNNFKFDLLKIVDSYFNQVKIYSVNKKKTG